MNCIISIAVEVNLIVVLFGAILHNKSKSIITVIILVPVIMIHMELSDLFLATGQSANPSEWRVLY